MNGLNKPEINLYGSSGIPPAYRPSLYSFPDDLPVIREYISWICEEMQVTESYMRQHHISRIFPVYLHRFMLIDQPGNPILSMYGSDIIFYADSFSKLLAVELLSYTANVPGFQTDVDDAPQLKFWID